MPKQNESIFPAESSQFFEHTRPGAREQIKSYVQLQQLLSFSAVELVFTRRRWPIKFTEPGHNKPWRRMLCTSNWKFLKDHRRLYKFRSPRGNKFRSKKWYEKKNLLITYDLIRRDWRMINADEYFVTSYALLETDDQLKLFKEFYQELRDKKSEKQLIRMFDE